MNNEDKSEPDPNWVEAPYVVHGIRWNIERGEWEKYMEKWEYTGQKPEGTVDLDDSDGRPPEEHDEEDNPQFWIREGFMGA